jgi:capsular polysaccharide biosynthesis protein
VDVLKKKISFKEEATSNVFNLSVKDKDPAWAVHVANVWAQEYIKHAHEIIYKAELLNIKADMKGYEDLLKELRSKVVENSSAVLSKDRLAIGAGEELNAKSPSDNIQLRIINAEVELNIARSKVDRLKERVVMSEKDVDIKAPQPGAVKLVSLATVPQDPVNLHTGRHMVAAGIVALMLGVLSILAGDALCARAQAGSLSKDLG